MCLLIGSFYYAQHFNTQLYNQNPAAYYLHSDSLFHDFLLNPKNAEKKYLKKFVQVQGIVQEVYAKKGNKLKITLRPNDIYHGISCIIDKAHSKIKQPLCIGKKITIKGLCMGKKSDVLLHDCIIVAEKDNRLAKH